MSSVNLPKWLLLFVFLGYAGCAGKYAKPETVEEPAIHIITTDDLIRQGYEVDAGDFSLRFAYNVGKNYAKNSNGISPDQTRHIFHELMGWTGYYIERGELEKARNYINNLEEQFNKHVQNWKIQIARMSLYNILSEFFLEQYEITKNQALLDSADAYVKKVFSEKEKEYCEAPGMSGIKKKINDEIRRAYYNLSIIIQKQKIKN